MDYILFLLSLIPIFYFGEVAGLTVLCDNCSYLSPAKQIVWKVPFMQLKNFFKYLKLSFENSSLRPIRLYFGIKEKHVLILCRFVNSKNLRC